MTVKAFFVDLYCQGAIGSTVCLNCSVAYGRDYITRGIHMTDANTKKEMKIEVKVDETIAAGIFSNFSNITHSPEEFIFDYLFIHPSPPPGYGKLRSRIVMTPAHAKRLLMALQENVAEHEKRFGEIKVVHKSVQPGSIQ